MNVNKSELIQLFVTISDIKSDIQNIKNTISTIDDINNKIEKRVDIDRLEQDILTTARLSISNAIKASFDKYDNPLSKMVESVFKAHSVELSALVTESLESTIRNSDFKQAISEAISHKLSRDLLSANESAYEKISNTLKQDSVFRSKVTLAINDLIQEYLNKEIKG